YICSVGGSALRAQGTQLPGRLAGVRAHIREPRICRHVRLGDEIARVPEVNAVPVVRITLAYTRAVGAGALRAPQERMVIDEFTCDRVVPIALGLGAERADHLGMAVAASLADIDIAAG